MKFEKIHNKGHANLFGNRQLESLTRANPLVIYGIYIPVIFGMLYYSKIQLQYNSDIIVVLFMGGFFAWTLFEYLVHRFVFHFHSRSIRAQKIVYILHGNHHEYPRDKQRLFMPPFPSLIISCTLFVFAYFMAALFGAPNNAAFSFFPGFIFGYLLYGSMHYAIHAWSPPFKWMKPLWRNHHLHHYKDEEHGFGVSSTFWDHVFGTMFDLKKEKEDKEKTSELMYERKNK